MIAPETQHLGILARWYAEPLTMDEAEKLLALSIKREQALLKRFGRPILSSPLKLIALHWLNEPTESHYQHLTSKKSASIHAEILKPLIYGQLLMSTKKEGAMEYLDKAFHQSRLLLRSEDYFLLIKRHQLLRAIPTDASEINGEPLQALLTTAGVIVRMQESRGKRPEFWFDRNDTYG